MYVHQCWCRIPCKIASFEQNMYIMCIVLCFTSTAIKTKICLAICCSVCLAVALVFQLKGLRSKQTLIELPVSHPEMRRLKSSHFARCKAQKITANRSSGSGCLTRWAEKTSKEGRSNLSFPTDTPARHTPSCWGSGWTQPACCNIQKPTSATKLKGCSII